MTAEHDVNPVTESPTPPDQLGAVEQAERKKKKKRDKVRSAWISFVGRILAQIMGAVATITLGLMVVHKYQGPAGKAQPAATETASKQAMPVRVVTPGELSLAVLPLENYSPDADGSFADAMTEALITDLSRLDGIRVLSRTSSMRYKHERRSVPEIGRELGVNFVLEGSVTKMDGRVRITAQLIDAKRDEHLWADSYERPMREVLSLQSRVANAIARSVKEAITSVARGPREIVRRADEPQPTSSNQP